MRMGYEVALKQVPRLVITPELRQAITVLQLPILELRQYVENQLLENPLLEVSDEDPSQQSQVTDPLDELYGSQDARPGAGNGDGGGRDDGSPEIDWEQYFADSSDIGYREWLPQSGTQDEISFENMVSSSPSLHEHLLFQLRLSVSTPLDMKVGELIIGNIDDDGYLRAGLDEIALMAGVRLHDVERVLHIVQAFEPSGVGARDVVECLVIQLGGLDLPSRFKRQVEMVIREHLEDLAEGRYSRIADALHISIREVQQAADVIRTLDPKPGRQFGGPGTPTYVIPDVVIERAGADYVVIVNDLAIPRLTLSPTYRRLLYSADSSADCASDFIKSRLNSALWLIKSIEQRRLTLQKVTECIVRFQRRFLDHGIRYLRPLTLREVADEIGVHESTVSRATSGKYVQTPRGTFELRFFFASGVATQEGDGAAAESVKKAIKDMIAVEDPARPLSDQAITERLRDSGIMICRRTVAKYREDMGIPASSKRRRY
ncbi:MAG TPA: RNA polymerase factor sigma-54 [Firmicutes bacterium]|nr:RNA polymerase factor sigma-54 [Bacillota bacterium]